MNMPVWKRLLFGIIAIALFFVTSELIFKVAGVKPLFVTEDPFVGFAGNIPLFIEEVQADGTIMLVTARNKLPAFNEPGILLGYFVWGDPLLTAIPFLIKLPSVVGCVNSCLLLILKLSGKS